MPTDARVLRILIANLLLRVAASAAAVVAALYLTQINENLRGVAAWEVSLIVAISYTAIELPLSPLAGAWSDRFGSRRLLIVGPLLAAAGTLLMAFSTATALLALGRLLGGGAAALTTPPMLKQMTAYTEDDPKLRSQAVSLYQLTGLLGFVIGSGAGGFLFAWMAEAAFSLLAAVYAAPALLLWAALLYQDESAPTGSTPPPKWGRLGGGEQSHWRVHLRLLRLPSMRGFVPAWLAFNLILGLWLSQIAYQLGGPQWAGQRLPGGFSDSEVGLLFAGYGGTILLGLLVWFWLLPRMRRSSALFVAAGGLVGTSVAVLLLNRWEGWLVWPALLLLAVSVMVEAGFAPATLALLGDISDEAQTSRGALMGLYNVLLGGGQLVGGWIGGLAAGWAAIDGLSYATLLLAALTVLFVLPLHRMEKMAKKDTDLRG